MRMAPVYIYISQDLVYIYISTLVYISTKTYEKGQTIYTYI